MDERMFQAIFRDAFSPPERKVVLEKRAASHNGGGGILSPMTPPSPKVPRVSPVATGQQLNTVHHQKHQLQQPPQLQIPSPLTPQTPTTPHSPPAQAAMSGQTKSSGGSALPSPITGPAGGDGHPAAASTTMTAAERQRMRNIAAADYFRRMKEEHARKEVEMQEARARQVEHALVLAREQVILLPKSK